MIETWIADIGPLCEEAVCRRYYDRLPRWRRDKADAYRQPADRARSVAAWTLYTKMREYYALSEETIYNLSHSGRYALCAVETDAGRESEGVLVGCDVEMIGKERPTVARRFFCRTEEARIAGSRTEEERAETFYRFWVLKESFVKAVREGLALELRSFEIQLDGPEPVLVRQPEKYPQRFYYKEYTPEAGDARAAVCSTDPEFGKLREIRLV